MFAERVVLSACSAPPMIMLKFFNARCFSFPNRHGENQAPSEEPAQEAAEVEKEDIKEGGWHRSGGH